jgi:sec-independent protein translocase protein TatA
MGAMELVIILVIVLVLFGAGRLPQVFASFGQGLKAFKDAQKDDAIDVTAQANARLADSGRAEVPPPVIEVEHNRKP